MKLNLSIVFLAVCSLAEARAESRSSANYSIATDTQDAGGRQVSSASYRVDVSIGGTGATTAVAIPAITAKSGYAGQLYDVTGFAVSASSPTVNESQTRQLSGAQLLDDSTRLAVSATAVSWSVLSGSAVMTISAGGLVLATSVYQDTGAQVQGSFQGSAATLILTVLNVNSDDLGIYAGDGLPDDWQVQYFGENNSRAGPTADPDGDGQDNKFEWVAGLNPTDRFSSFKLRIEIPIGQPQYRNLVFGPIVAGRSYKVVSKTSLTGGSQWIPLTDPLPASDNGAERTITDTMASSKSKFYRVDVTNP